MDVLMPQLGETVAEGKISKWFVSAGDVVKPGDNLFEIETDKVSMEVPAIAAGMLAAIHVQAGEVAPVGAVVAIIQGKGETVSTDKPVALAKPAAPLIPTNAGHQKSEELGPRFRGDERKLGAPFKMEPFREVRSPERSYGPARLPGGTVVTPLARRLAGEAGIDLANIKGSGPHGRIVARDIETAQKSPARTLASAAQAIPHIVLTTEVDIGQSLALCVAAPPIEMADVIVKAWAAALRRVMAAEATDIALTAGKTSALVRDAASKTLTAIAAARGEVGDVRDAATAISIPGVAGITSVSSVPQSPRTTLLSIGAARRAPVEAADGSVKFASVMTVTLSCDHRAIDGALGAELLGTFKGFVEQPVTMIV